MSAAAFSTRDLKTAICAGCVVAFLGFGFAASFGVLLRPMSEALGWERQIFSLSVAIQLLCWGITQPIAGMVADRYGTARVLALGCLLAALGFYIRGVVHDPGIFIASGILVGAGTSACSFPIVIVALGKVVTPRQRMKPFQHCLFTFRPWFMIQGKIELVCDCKS